MPDHRTPEQEDLLVQNVILGLILKEQPTHLTMRDLAAEIGNEIPAQDAVKELIVKGLLRREGESFLPTWAAIHFRKLSA